MINFEVTDHLKNNYVPVPESGRWLWLGGWDSHGYGRVGRRGKELCSSHRLFYEIHNGEIPEGMYVCHRCDTRACVNPEHLFLGSAKQNMQDMRAKGRGRSVYDSAPRYSEELKSAVRNF